MNEHLPREKALYQGINTLSVEELLSILIGSGTATNSVFDISRELMRSASGSLVALSKMDHKELKKTKGIGTVTALELMACFELLRRTDQEQVASILVTSAEQAYNVIRPELSHLAHEEFWVLHLAPSGKVLSKQKVSQGGLTSAVVDQRIIFKKCYALSTHSLILCHNHPSGDPVISQHDMDITSQIQRTCSMLGFGLRDHIIVCGQSYVSFVERGYL